MTQKIEITAGFLPLTDSAILVVARECGFAEEEGVALTLMRETSWANIRDRMAVNHFQASHMLAPMPIASVLGLTPLPHDIVVPMALGYGGNAVTVSTQLSEAMARAATGAAAGPADPAGVGKALAAVVGARKRDGKPPLQFAVVHPHSGHNFELRYWLAACGVVPEEDIAIVIVPPPFMPDALSTGQIDGFCVGEPWNSVAVASGAGKIATVKAAIWKSSPDKVLGVRADWAHRHEAGLASLLRAMYRAAEWCAKPDNHSALAHILARPDYLGQPAVLILRALDGSIVASPAGAEKARPSQLKFFEPFAGAATFPWQSHALWFYSQMVRWGQVKHTPAHAEAARQCYRPDLYRAALRPLSVPIPSANAKVEGALTQAVPVGVTRGSLVLGPDGFFDGKVFDPEKLDGYLSGFAR